VGHGLGGGANEPEALDPVALGAIPGDHAQVGKGQGGPSSGLGAGNEEGPGAGWSWEWR
jgi:hypothetical protein